MGAGTASQVLSSHDWEPRLLHSTFSEGYVREARGACVNGVSIRCIKADGERLPFPTGYFDRVWGNAILHHLHLPIAGSSCGESCGPAASRSSVNPGVRTRS